MDITQAATNSARYEHLIALKCTAEAKAKAAETRVGKKSQPTRQSRQWQKLSAIYDEMAANEMKAAANRGPEV
jgi:hypothetical protein